MEELLRWFTAGNSGASSRYLINCHFKFAMSATYAVPGDSGDRDRCISAIKAYPPLLEALLDLRDNTEWKPQVDLILKELVKL